MTTTLSGDYFGKLWLSSSWVDSNLLKRLMFEKLDKIRVSKSNFFSKCKELPDIATLNPMWMEEAGYPSQLVGTLGNSGTTFAVTGPLWGNASASNAATYIRLLKVARVGSILRFDSPPGLQACLRSTSIGANTNVLTGAVTGGSTLPGDTTGYTVTVVGSPYTDSADYSNPNMLDRKTRYTSTQIFERAYSILKTRENVAMEVVGNEVEISD